MKVVIQRVKEAQVTIDDELVGDISQGLLLLVGVGPDDEQEDLDYAVRKITNMRIFSDDMGKMNLSVQDIKGSILSVSQFTLFADTKKAIVRHLQVPQNLIKLKKCTSTLMKPLPNSFLLKQVFLALTCKLV